jgi:hypothetical protein
MTSYKPLPELAGPLYGKEPWPLRFFSHTFDAACFNTLACSILYNRHEFGNRKYEYDGSPIDKPSGPPPFETWRDRWTGRHSILPRNGKTFPGPVKIEWSSMDGRHHVASLDLGALFKDRLVLHKVGRYEVKEGWLGAKSIDPISPSILVEVNDNVVNVFMRALVATGAEQIPGNAGSHFRDDLILAWTHNY